jgi:VanZ family protein
MARDKHWLHWIAVLAWMGVIFFLSSQAWLPHPAPSFFDDLQDVLGHFAAYGVLALLLHRALTGSGSARAVRYAMLIALLYALSDEIHQAFVPGRHPDPFDILTDCTGAAAVLLVLSLLHSRRARRPLR